MKKRKMKTPDALYNYYVIQTSLGDKVWFTIRRSPLGRDWMANEGVSIRTKKGWAPDTRAAKGVIKYLRHDVAEKAMLAIAHEERAIWF